MLLPMSRFIRLVLSLSCICLFSSCALRAQSEGICLFTVFNTKDGISIGYMDPITDQPCYLLNEQKRRHSSLLVNGNIVTSISVGGMSLAELRRAEGDAGSTWHIRLRRPPELQDTHQDVYVVLADFYTGQKGPVSEKVIIPPEDDNGWVTVERLVSSPGLSAKHDDQAH